MIKLTICLLGCLPLTAQDTPESIRALIQELGSEEISVRNRASLRLRKCGNAAQDLLRDASRSSSPEIRVRALELLRQLEADRLVTAELRADEYLQDLADRLLSPESSVRLRLAQALDSSRLRSALPVLKYFLGDKDAAVRAAACGAIGQYGDKGAAPEVAALLKDPSPPVRVAAIEVLAAFRDRTYDASLVLALEEDDPRVRSAAAAALGALEPERGGQLSRMLEDPDPQVRRGALAGIAATRDPRYTASVLPLVNHPSGNLRMDARILLRNWKIPIPEAEVPAALDRDSVLECESGLLDAVPAVTSRTLQDRLASFVGDRSRHPVTRRAAARLLKRSGLSTVPEVLREEIRSTEDAGRRAAILVAAEFSDPTLNALFLGLWSEKLPQETTLALCEGIGLLPEDPATTEWLLGLTRHADPELSLGALRALGRHQDPRCAELAWAELHRDDRASRQNHEKLVELVLGSDPLRLRLLLTMGDSGGPWGSDIMEGLTRKPRPLADEEIERLLKVVRPLHFRPVEALVACGAKKAGGALASMLEGSTGRGQALLLDALRRLGSSEQASAVLPCLESSDPNVVAATLLALSEIGSKSHVASAVRFLSDQRLILGPRRFPADADVPPPTLVLEAAIQMLEKIVGIRWGGLSVLETAQKWRAWWEENKSRF